MKYKKTKKNKNVLKQKKIKYKNECLFYENTILLRCYSDNIYHGYAYDDNYSFSDNSYGRRYSDYGNSVGSTPLENNGFLWYLIYFYLFRKSFYIIKITNEKKIFLNINF